MSHFPDADSGDEHQVTWSPFATARPESRPAAGLIARDRELADLEHALRQARRGESAVVVLRGEPGVGKSALIANTVARATDFGIVHLRGSASGDDSLPKEWPAPLASLKAEPARSTNSHGEAVRTRVRTAASSDSRQTVSGTSSLAAPAVGERQSDRRRSGEGNTEPVDPSLVEDAVTALDSLAVTYGSPLLVTIDDAHLLPAWLCRVLSAAALTRPAVHPIVLVIAIRDVPHVPQVVASYEAVPERHLTGLTWPQSETLFKRLHVTQPQPAVMKKLVESSAGIPQALLDIATRLHPDVHSGLQPLPDPLPIGSQLVTAFGAGLQGLPEETLTALMTTASGAIPLAVLQRVLKELGLDMKHLTPAVRLGVVAVRSNRVDFAHPLVRLAAYHQRPEQERSAVHAVIARVFDLFGNIELSAAHAELSGTASPAALTKLYGQAVRIALDRCDLRSAAQYEEMLASIVESTEVVAHHLVRAAAVWTSAGETERALRCLDRCQRFHTSDRIRAEVSYYRSRALIARGVDRRLALDLADAARLVERAHAPSASIVFADAAAFHFLSGDAAEALELAGRAVELAGQAATAAPYDALARALRCSIEVLTLGTAEDSDRFRTAVSILVSSTGGLPASPQIALVIGLGTLSGLGADAAGRWARWLSECAAATGDRSLSVLPPLLGALRVRHLGRLDEAEREAERAIAAANEVGQDFIAVRALLVLVELNVTMGNVRKAFAAATRLFANSVETERQIRALTYRSLAELELQRGSSSAALGWLRAAEVEMTAPEATTQIAAPNNEPRLVWAATQAEVLIHEGRIAEVREMLDSIERAARSGVIPPAWVPCFTGLVAEDLETAVDQFEQALTLASGEPASLRARIEFWYGWRLAQSDLAVLASERMASAISTLRTIGADGWVPLYESVVRGLEEPARVQPALFLVPGGMDPSVVAAPTGLPIALGNFFASEPVERIDPNATWEIAMLGSFAVRQHGELLTLPASLAATALKIVALRRRVLVEELAESLWPESPPGVGLRRLRNVLWRIRSACGDILVRDDKFILLSQEAVSDVMVLRRLAAQALDPVTPTVKAAELARAALKLYHGELLPAERYADWAATAREALSQLHVQLIELLVADAIEDARSQEALGLLDQLMQVDPYNESHYIRAAQIHADTGNRRRALATLNRVERVLADLGIPPSAELTQLSSSFG